MYPFVDDWDAQEKKKLKFEAKKQRIFMRGIKIGKKLEGGGRRGMGIFETKRQKDQKKAEFEAKAAQEEKEKLAKQEMSDESLGIF